jgi:TP901 family phage tail tape measure protein
MSNENMHTTVRVDTASDTKAVDILLSKIRAISVELRKLGVGSTKSLNNDLAKVSGTAEKVSKALNLGQEQGMASLRKRFTLESRMNRQREKETSDAAKAEKLFHVEALSALRERMTFQSRMQRQAAQEARDVARVRADATRQAARAEMSAARESARAWREARQEAGKAWSRGKDAITRTTRPIAAVGAAAGAGTAALVRKSLRAEGDVDAAEINSRIYGGLSKDAARKLRDGWAAPLAEQLGIGADSLLKSYVDAIKLGIPATGAQAFAGLATKASAAWEVSFEAVSDILGTVNQVLTSTGQAFDIEKIKSVANVIQYLAAKQSTTPEKLMSFLQRGAGAAQILGMSQEAGLAFGSASTSLGNQAGQSGRMFDYVASRLVELPKLTRKKGDEGRQARQMLQALGYGGAEDVERRRRADPDGFMSDFMERFSKIRDPKKHDQALRFFAGREWFGEFGRMVKGIDTYKEAVKLQKEAKKFDAIGDVWELHKTTLSFVFKQFTAGWKNILGEFGKELSPLARQAGDYFLQWSATIRQGGLSARFKAALEGFIEGLGFKDLPDLLKRTFGKPGEGNAGSIESWGDAFRGFGQGLRDVATTIRGFFSIFTGKDATPETIGRWTGRILAFAAACVIAAPAVSLLGGMGMAILGFAAIVKGASATLRALGLMGGSTAATAGAGAGTAGTAAAAGSGVLARMFRWLRLGPLAAAAMPLTSDASKEDNDRLMKRLGTWAQGRKKDERSTWVDPPPRVQKQSATDDWRGLIAPISVRSDDIVRGVERTARAVERLGAKFELATLTTGGIGGSGVARAAVGSAPASAAGLGYVPGAGGSGLYGSKPGSKLPDYGSGQRFGGGGDNASPDQKSGGSRSWRNNNPGNIEYGSFARSMGATGHDGRFAKFPSYEAGRKAQEKLLFESKGYRDLTLSQAIRRWAPASENNVPAYLRAMGGDPGKRMSEYSPEQRAKLLDAMQRHEGWKPGSVAGGGSSGPGDAAAPAGTPRLKSGLATITTATGRRIQVAAEFAQNFQGFINDYEKAGGVIGPHSGGNNERPHNASYHPIGRAIDINQTGRGIRGGGRNLPLDVEDALAAKWGLRSGNSFRSNDNGHFEVHSRADAQAALIRNGVVNAAKEALGGKPGTYNGGGQDLGSGITGKPFSSAADLAKTSPAESLAKKAPPASSGRGGRPGASVAPVFHITQAGDPEHTANLVQRRIQDAANYATHDISYESA